MLPIFYYKYHNTNPIYVTMTTDVDKSLAKLEKRVQTLEQLVTRSDRIIREQDKKLKRLAFELRQASHKIDSIQRRG